MNPTPPSSPAAAPSASAPSDPLGYDRHAQALWLRIQTALAKGGKNPDGTEQPPLGDDPLVIGVFGEWGAGKSTLLQRVENLVRLAKIEKINAHKGDDAFELLVPVQFQPWKYEHERHMLVPLLLHILSELDDVLKKSESIEGKLVQALHTGGDWVAGHIGAVVEMLSKASKESKAALAVMSAEPHAGILLGAAGWLAKLLAKFKKAPATAAKDFEWRDNGRSYYELQQLLQKITRPAHFAPVLGKRQKVHRRDFRVNFVVFIDDLDRCLPENAVKTLELIKTVFNVGSFAFVLALDDEVIERGIGHRYKEYKLQDKKPEMPITGFEYLEKIVHLPFRLPAMTKAQAAELIRLKELEILPAPKLPVRGEGESDEEFELKQAVLEVIDPRLFYRYAFPSVGSMQVDDALEFAERPTDLQKFLLNSFDHYVPRKLIRAVELVHQVEKTARLRGKGLRIPLGDGVHENEYVSPKRAPLQAAPINEQLLLGILLFQLFQPEVFRVIRRKPSALGSLMGAFVDDSNALGDGSNVSESALWHWASGFKSLGKEARENWLAKQKAPYNHATVAEFLGQDVVTDLYARQQIRLPLAERLVAHLQIERHAFNPFKVAKAMADLLGMSGVRDFRIEPYLEYLSEDAPLPEKAAAAPAAAPAPVPAPVPASAPTPVQAPVSTPAPAPIQPKPKKPAKAPVPTSAKSRPEPRPTHRDDSESKAPVSLSPSYSTMLVERMTSADLGAQGELPGMLEKLIPEDRVLDEPSANQLHKSLSNWLAANDSPDKPDKGQNHQALQRRLLFGLQHLASRLSPERDGAKFWALVKGCVRLPEKPGELAEDPKLNVLYTDVRSMLRQDDRFEPKRWYLLKERRAGNPVVLEPIPGFIRFNGGEFPGGHEAQDNNPPGIYDAGAPFYMARSHTTVDQYKAFLYSGKYADKRFWDAAAPEPREAPGNPERWAKQRRVGSRAVCDVKWFEARAYCRWLSEQLQPELAKFSELKGYSAALPTEAQWEFAARSQPRTSTKSSPWLEGDPTPIAALANIENSIGHASCPGSYAPSPSGLWDMTGNLLQWQNNEYSDRPSRIALGTEPNSPALRGGSWVLSADLARASSRSGDRPDDWDDSVGFRVVLSLASPDP